MPYPYLVVLVEVQVILPVIHQELISGRAYAILPHLQGEGAENPGAFIIELLIEGPVSVFPGVLAKQKAATEMAGASQMEYRMFAGSEIMNSNVIDGNSSEQISLPTV